MEMCQTFVYLSKLKDVLSVAFVFVTQKFHMSFDSIYLYPQSIQAHLYDIHHSIEISYPSIQSQRFSFVMSYNSIAYKMILTRF